MITRERERERKNNVTRRKSREIRLEPVYVRMRVMGPPFEERRKKEMDLTGARRNKRSKKNLQYYIRLCRDSMRENQLEDEEGGIEL